MNVESVFNLEEATNKRSSNGNIKRDLPSHNAQDKSHDVFSSRSRMTPNELSEAEVGSRAKARRGQEIEVSTFRYLYRSAT